MGAEPGLRVFLVRIYDKSWIRREIIGRPFPYIADHLPAANCGCSFGIIGDITAATQCPIEVGRATGWNAGSGRFPLEFGRETSAGPAAISLCFNMTCSLSERVPANS